MKIVFFGTPEFAVPFFEALTQDSDFEILAVVTQPDKKSGRGQKIKPPAMKAAAKLSGIPVWQFSTLKSKEAEDELRSLSADLFIVVAYGKLIPRLILDIPPRGVINVHPSLLPKYRGPSPMQWAIREGNQTTGISIMLLDEGMDTGPILAQKTIDLSPVETAVSLEKKIHDIGPNFLTETVKKHTDGKLLPVPQKGEVVLTRLLNRDDGKINWTSSAIQIERQIRAYVLWPSAWTELKIDGRLIRIKILSAKVSNESSESPPGTITEKVHRFFVSTNDERLEVLSLQIEGKPPSPASAFLVGHRDWIGQRFE